MAAHAETSTYTAGVRRWSPTAVVVAVWSGLVLALCLAMAVLALLGLDMNAITRDRVEITGGPWETAALANVGFVLWGAVGAVGLFAALLAPVRARLRCLLFGAACTYLAFDDALRIHEVVLPKAGIPEQVPLALYAIAAAVGFGRLLPTLAAPLRALLLLALGSFAGSIALDQAPFATVEAVEDVLKLVGIATLVAFAFAWLRTLVRPPA